MIKAINRSTTDHTFDAYCELLTRLIKVTRRDARRGNDEALDWLRWHGIPASDGSKAKNNKRTKSDKIGQF